MKSAGVPLTKKGYIETSQALEEEVFEVSVGGWFFVSFVAGSRYYMHYDCCQSSVLDFVCFLEAFLVGDGDV